MTDQQLSRAFLILKNEITKWEEPIVTQYAQRRPDPYKILISTMISLRTKDAVTGEATDRLWKLARTPRGMAARSPSAVARAIYPAGFYKTKARHILKTSEIILKKYQGLVPPDIEELVQLPGVGRKTANLVVTKGFHKPGICVDTHVHRIVNRWGYVLTKTPDQTEMVLRKKLPRRFWLVINDLLVTYGQNLCLPVSPWCSRCKIKSCCAQRGVGRRR